jgi:hypothetical protein
MLSDTEIATKIAAVDLMTLCVNGILCGCGQVYRGQAGQSVDTSVKKQHQHIHLQQLDWSAMAECSFNL